MRLPRALGVEPALNMILSGEQVPCELLAMAPGQKLFDRLVPQDALGAAVALAQEKAAVRPLPRCATWPPRTRMPTPTSSLCATAWRRRSPLSGPAALH